MHDDAGKLKSIQILRGAAALLVLISHLQKEIRRTIGPTFLDATNVEIVGQAGVDLFFIISGFIMVYVTRNLPQTPASAANFLLKRVLRVAPLYWCLTFLTLGVTFADPSLKYHNHIDFQYVISSFLFIPFPRDDGHFTPVLGLGWTLNFEMLFYTLFCVAILNKEKFRPFIMAGLLVVLPCIGLFIDRSYAQPWFWTRPIILEFLMGGVVAHLFMRGVSVPTTLAFGMVISGLLGLQLSGQLPDPTAYEIRFWAWGGPSALIVAGVVLSQKSLFAYLPTRLSHLAERVGDGSYSLYLVHMFTIRITTIIVGKFHFPTIPHLIACYVIAITLSLFLSDWMYRHLELSLNRFGRRFLPKDGHTNTERSRGASS